MFEVLDGMMLKDGYLYKKISMDSLSFWGVMPTEDELLKFEPAKKDESTDVQWLTQLFGEKKKKEVERIKPKLGSKGDKGGGKSEGSSSTNSGHNYELHDLVFIGYISDYYPATLWINLWPPLTSLYSIVLAVERILVL